MKKNSTFIEWLSLPLFLILTPLISLAIPLLLPFPPEVVPVFMALIPALMAIVLTLMTEGRKGVLALLRKLTQWRVAFKWYAVALSLSLGIRLTLSLVALLFGWIPAIQIRPWPLPLYILIGIFTIYGAVMEELGWRGYALPRLLADRSALFSALLIGILWGALHLGLTLPGFELAGLPVPAILIPFAFSVVLTWLFIQTRGNLVMVILCHAGQNFFVIFNEGMTAPQILWLMSVVNLALALILTLLFGADLQRRIWKEAATVEAK
jgi:membrane protease YdiL (CAAX protease family)